MEHRGDKELLLPVLPAVTGHHPCRQQRGTWDFGVSVGHYLPEPASYKQVEITTLGKK